MRVFMSREEVERRIDDLAGGTIFSVDFEKRDGSLRTMTCRMDVQKGVKGTGEGWRRGDERPLRTVYDMKAAGFRTVPTDRVIRIKVKGDQAEVSA